jgi:hypothetical protein
MIFLPIDGAGTDTPLLWGLRSAAHWRGASQTSQQPDIPSLRLPEGAAAPYGLAHARLLPHAAQGSE